MKAADQKLDSHQLTPHLFTIRVWKEEGTNGTYEWRGSIRHGIDGQVQYFVGFHTQSFAPLSIDPPLDNGPSLSDGADGSSQSSNSLADVMQLMIEQLKL